MYKFNKWKSKLFFLYNLLLFCLFSHMETQNSKLLHVQNMNVNLLLHLITLFAQFIQQKKIHTHWRNVVEEHIAISRKIKITVNVKKQSTILYIQNLLILEVHVRKVMIA